MNNTDNEAKVVCARKTMKDLQEMNSDFSSRVDLILSVVYLMCSYSFCGASTSVHFYDRCLTLEESIKFRGCEFVSLHLVCWARHCIKQLLVW